jgi:hypothetical protein
MNTPKCTEYDYINFLVAAQQMFSCRRFQAMLGRRANEQLEAVVDEVDSDVELVRHSCRRYK